MKKLMLTTALSSVVAFGAVAQTQMTETAPNGAATANVPAFLVSDLTGKTLYTLDSEDTRALSASGEAGMDANTRANESLRWTSSDAFISGRDNWENIGSIGDVVMTQDGEVRGVILDVGGFLGFGTHTVMVATDDLYFVTEPDSDGSADDFSVMITMSQDQLENLPEWNPDQLRMGFEMSTNYRQDTGYQQDTGLTEGANDAMAGMQADPMADSTAPAAQADAMGATDTGVFGGDYAMLDGEERTADRLIGANVHDASGDDIGSVSDVVLDGDQRVSGLLVDVGGFLGIGSHTVNLPIDQAQIGWSETSDDVRVQVSMTAEQLEAMPEYEG